MAKIRLVLDLDREQLMALAELVAKSVDRNKHQLSVALAAMLKLIADPGVPPWHDRPDDERIREVARSIERKHPDFNHGASQEDSYARASANALWWVLGRFDYKCAPMAIRDALDELFEQERLEALEKR